MIKIVSNLEKLTLYTSKAATIKASDVKLTRVPDADGNRMLRAGLGGAAGGLLGAALGAGSGLFSEAFLANPEQAQYLRRALQGAGIGLVAGAGAGTAFGASYAAADMQHTLQDLFEDLKNNVNKNVENARINVDHPVLGRVQLSLHNTEKSPIPRPEA